MKLTLSQKGHFTGRLISLNKMQKTRRDFQKSSKINTRGAKANVQNRHGTN